MSITQDLLWHTLGTAPAILTYGGPGLKKSHLSHTLPPPILFHDWEGGIGSIGPWIRAIRQWDSSDWVRISQEQRESFAAAVPEEARVLKGIAPVPPKPLIDVITYEPMEPGSYDHFALQLGSFDYGRYSSTVVDSLQEFSQGTQTKSKPQSEGKVLTRDTLMAGKMWMGAQERAAMQIRYTKELKKRGVVVYLIGSEAIDKEYVTDPLSQKKNEAQEPYSVKGTVALPGQLTSIVPHQVDLMFRVRAISGKPMLVLCKESLPSGACWETKDRYGRLDQDYYLPSFIPIFKVLFGDDIRKVYAAGNQDNNTASS